MTTHQTYFDGGVQSLGFVRHGRRQTAGVIAPGEYHFATGGAERMSVISGELHVRFDGAAVWTIYPQGSAFEIAANAGFDVKALEPAAYLCEFL